MNNKKIQIILAIACVHNVAKAAHHTHIAGIIQNQNINNGSNIKFNKTVTNTIFIGILTSHIHLKIDWNIKNQNTKTIHKKEILKKDNASEKASFSTHIKFNIKPEEKYQITDKLIDITTTNNIVWAAIWFTISCFLAQQYWAINVAHAIANQLQTEIKKKVIGKLTETAATAFSHNLHTQNASINWYALWSIFANNIGIAKVKICFTIDKFKFILFKFFIV